MPSQDGAGWVVFNPFLLLISILFLFLFGVLARLLNRRLSFGVTGTANWTIGLSAAFFFIKGLAALFTFLGAT